MSIIVFFSTKITSIGLVNMTLATISRDLVELIQLVTCRDEQVTKGFVFQRRISDGNKLIRDILDAVEFCDSAVRIEDLYMIFCVSSVRILKVRASPTLSPKPTNLPNRSAVSQGKPGLCAYERESPVGKYKPSFVPRQLESSLDVVRSVIKVSFAS